MSETGTLPNGMNLTQAQHLPIVAQFCEQLGLIDTVNAAVPTGMAVDVGTMVQFMVLDTLSGRSPLYRLEEFAAAVDTGLLLGRKLPAKAFNDTTLGRTLGAIYAAGTEQLFSQVALRAASVLPAAMDFRHIRYDTTSVSVWGDYLLRQNEEDLERLLVTEGYSKDHRPDLKQFLIQMLCVHHNIPVLGGCADGNASDKTLNLAMLTRLSKHMAKHGLAEGAFVYIADAAVVTAPNLTALGGNLIITRLPFTYQEAARVVGEAVTRGEWTEVTFGVRSSGNRKAAHYRVCERTVTLAGQEYRAIVVHSDAHDQRRQKRLARQLVESRQQADAQLRQVGKVRYFCREDAEAAAEKLRREPSPYHYCDCQVAERLTYAPGRPPANGERKVAKVRHVLTGTVVERSAEAARTREAAGCFVLLTNTPTTGPMAHSPEAVLAAYKEQHGIEQNFGFLKDPNLVNDLFLKKPEHIEALGFILLTSLLIWRLMECVMRAYLKQTDTTVPGWDRKPTPTPTAFMMTTKFRWLLVAEVAGAWFFPAPLSATQQEYIRALGLSEARLLRRDRRQV